MKKDAFAIFQNLVQNHIISWSHCEKFHLSSLCLFWASFTDLIFTLRSSGHLSFSSHTLTIRQQHDKVILRSHIWTGHKFLTLVRHIYCGPDFLGAIIMTRCWVLPEPLSRDPLRQDTLERSSWPTGQPRASSILRYLAGRTIFSSCFIPRSCRFRSVSQPTWWFVKSTVLTPTGTYLRLWR